jgi:DNA-binding response OmpR family regulator
MPCRPRCLIVEDQALIGMSLEASLEEAGFDVIGPFARKAQALASLDSETPDLALLDIMLPDGSSVELARELKRRAVPFAIYSGLKPEADTPEFKDVLWLEKPVSRRALTDALSELASISRSQSAA